MTRREQLLAEMERVVPWRELCALIEPVYPKTALAQFHSFGFGQFHRTPTYAMLLPE
jgi:hypothetical protein